METDSKERVLRFKDEREFYHEIEQRLSHQGFQILETMKKNPDSFKIKTKPGCVSTG